MLPVICFVDDTDHGFDSDEFISEILSVILKRGHSWISRTHLPNGRIALRACITNHRTAHSHVDQLIAELCETREDVLARAHKICRAQVEPKL